MDDQLYDDIVLYVSTKDYPSRVVNIVNQPNQKKAAKRAIREKSKDFHAKDGVLYKDGKRVLRVNEVTSVLQSLHSGKYTGGHLGRDKTFQKVKETFYWRGMKEDVRNFVRDCDICTRVNIAPPKTAPPLNSITVPSKVWSLVGVDIIGPLPTTKNGNKYVVAATDHFSKWSTAAAIPTKTAANVTKFLLSSICTYGPMDAIITDQGREFTNAVIDELTEELNIDHRISSAYHPQTNGQRERDNRTLKEMLTKVCNKEGDNWDNLLESVLFAYRTSCHASTKCTPFEVMFGRKARIFKVSENINNTACEFTKDALLTICENRRDLNKCVSQNICKAQAKQKKDYDSRNKSHTSMEKGTFVLIKNAKKIRRFGAKLSPRWTGPYEVVETLTKGRVKLKNCSSGVTLSNIYHTTLLKRYTASTSLISKGSHKRIQPITKLPQKKRSLKSNDQQRQKETDLGDVEPNQSNLLTITKQQQSPKTMFSPPPLEICKTLCDALNIKFVRRPAYKSEKKHAGQPTKVHRVRGDGNCFFRAICKAVSGSEIGHLKCRTSIVNYMDTKPVSVKLAKYLNSNVKTYLNDSKMKESSVWATDAEIMGTASLLKMDIYVYASYGRCQDGNIKYVWLRYPSSFSMSEHPKTRHGLYIQNLNNDHFDVVLEC